MPEDLNSMLGIESGRSGKPDQADLTVVYLDYLKTHSACKGLRGSINATFWFNACLLLIGAIWCIFILFSDWNTEFEAMEAKVGLVAVFFAINTLIVYRQIALMIVTFIDSVVIRNRNAERHSGKES